MKKRIVNILGYEIEIFDFGYKQYMYPRFNGDAEFEVTHNGFRLLHHYLRMVNWLKNLNND